jgi:Icc-related predicted phosphoesterase
VKIKVISDIHLEHYHACQIFPHLGRGDILILAGDILCAKHLKKNGFLKDVYMRFLGDCSKNYEKVLYVLGNHEFYGYNYEGVHKTIKEHLPDNFHLMENETVTIGDYHFIGFTLWTNFRNGNPIEMMEAERCMNDYKMIRIGTNYRKLRAQDTLNFHLESRNYLLNQLETLKDNVFVIGHHAPSYQSVADEFKTATCNSAYCSDLDNLILSHPQIKYFVHGHIHTFFDYKIGDCRVICNPAGYPGTNTGFNPHLYIKL